MKRFSLSLALLTITTSSFSMIQLFQDSSKEFDKAELIRILTKKCPRACEVVSFSDRLEAAYPNANNQNLYELNLLAGKALQEVNKVTIKQLKYPNAGLKAFAKMMGTGAITLVLGISLHASFQEIPRCGSNMPDSHLALLISLSLLTSVAAKKTYDYYNEMDENSGEYLYTALDRKTKLHSKIIEKQMKLQPAQQYAPPAQ